MPPEDGAAANRPGRAAKSAADDSIIIPPRLDEVIVKVLERGKEPRRKLRYCFKAGQHQSALVLISGTLSMTLNGRQLPQRDAPPVSALLKMNVAAEQERGTSRLHFTLGNEPGGGGKGDRNRKNPVHRMLRAFEAVTVTQQIDARGVVVDSEFELPEHAEPNLRRGWLQTQHTVQNRVLLPEQNVGVGAEWEATQDVELATSTRQTTRYKLIAFKGKRGTVHARVEQIGRPDLITAASNDQIENRLDRMRATGTGQLDFHLSSPFGYGKIIITTDSQHTQTALNSDSRNVSEFHSVQTIETRPLPEAPAE